MKLLHTLLVIFTITLSFGSFSQSKAVEGTFQLMTTNQKVNEVFTTDIYSIIESNREINDVAIVKIGEYTWLRILSLNTINSPNFVPLPSEIIVIEPNDPAIINSTSNNLNK